MNNLEIIFLIASFVLSLAALWVLALGQFLKWQENTFSKIGLVSFGLIFLSLLLSLVYRGLQLERFPISNLYETLILFACSVAGICLLLLARYKLNFFALPGCIFVLGLLIYAGMLPPVQREATPLLPSLQSYWRPIHVPPLLISYAFFALAAVAGLLYLLEDKLKKNDAKRLDFYQDAIYRCISFGFPLLTFGIVTGALWANHSWGNLWQWDPKENLALVTWFCYAAYLHLRLSGRASSKTLAWITIGGIFATYMTYLGINHFNLGGLHTYGRV